MRIHRLRLAAALLIAAVAAAAACGQPPAVPIPTVPTPVPPAQPEPSTAVLAVTDFTVPAPSRVGSYFLYLPTFALHETGGVTGATIQSVNFFDGDGMGLLTVRILTHVSPGGTWTFENIYDDVDDSEPLTSMRLQVNFIGDDQRAGSVDATWPAPSQP